MNALWQYEELEETPGMGEIVQYETFERTDSETKIQLYLAPQKIRRVIARDVSRETWEAIQEAMNAQEDLREYKSRGLRY